MTRLESVRRPVMEHSRPPLFQTRLRLSEAAIAVEGIRLLDGFVGYKVTTHNNPATRELIVDSDMEVSEGVDRKVWNAVSIVGGLLRGEVCHD